MLCYDNYEMLTRPMDVMADHKPLTLTSPKQRQGSRFEQRACEFLQAQGLQLIAQNWQQPKVGELDLIMLETGQAWSTLVFIEVRQRQHSGFGDAALSVTASKQRKVIKTARYFLQAHPEYSHYECRFDVIAYDTNKINTHSNAANNTDKNNRDFTNKSKSQTEWLKGAFITSAW
ncbi:hypothetical protein GCM10016272_26000 [Psychrobacter glaciei]|uniref:UPF0102 protein GCM10016272_26000 n=1 Tax=Psychrobacter glaciei TaxID=619771 RepID=A0ABQ3GTK3_9GAMM|nr:YraN family protein [Psychrobacter glaciei]GHD37631.1 hypothetical protein GCM10016272_26000 [Psychrobacter glaciei]